jgi:hypothetical protein
MLPRLSGSAKVLLEELRSFGTGRIIDAHHLRVFVENYTLDFGDRFFIILGELRMNGYIERVGDGYRVICGRCRLSELSPAASASSGSARPMRNPCP